MADSVFLSDEESGEVIEYELLGTVINQNIFYVILKPVADESVERVVMEYIGDDEDGEERFEIVENPIIAQAVYVVFQNGLSEELEEE